MNILEFKFIAAATIFFAAFLVGLLPTTSSERHPRLVSISEAVASGIFLGAALFHMLPDAEHAFQGTGFTRLPFAIMICVAAFFVLIIIEQTAKYYLESATRSFTAVLLLLVLSIHAITAGAALGINESLSNAVVIYIAIIAHKSSESFALVVALHKSFQQRRQVIVLLFFFSLMTPVGILLATSISSAMAHDQASLTEAVFNSVTAGTFLYVGTLDTLGRQLKPDRLISRVGEFMSLLFGMAIMGVIALWV